MDWGWFTALIIYLIPVVSMTSNWSELVDETREGMIMSGAWYPSLAPWVAAMFIILWPLFSILDIIPERKDR